MNFTVNGILDLLYKSPNVIGRFNFFYKNRKKKKYKLGLQDIDLLARKRIDGAVLIHHMDEKAGNYNKIYI